MNESRRRLWILGLLAAGALFRAGYTGYLYLRPSGPPAAEWAAPDGYDTMARNLLAYGELSVVPGQPSTEREPFYSILLAAAHWILGPSLAAGLALTRVPPRQTQPAPRRPWRRHAPNPNPRS